MASDKFIVYVLLKSILKDKDFEDYHNSSIWEGEFSSMEPIVFAGVSK